MTTTFTSVFPKTLGAAVGDAANSKYGLFQTLGARVPRSGVVPVG